MECSDSRKRKTRAVGRWSARGEYSGAMEVANGRKALRPPRIVILKTVYLVSMQRWCENSKSCQFVDGRFRIEPSRPPAASDTGRPVRRFRFLGMNDRRGSRN